ncbi:MAG: hypothetical protein HN348_35650, partial [Proteobacteria bacterium]|nr:hypothetical protein [Pseudomonadota bacterium]
MSDSVTIHRDRSGPGGGNHADAVVFQCLQGIHSQRFDIPKVGKDTTLALPIASPVLWNAEKPRLYVVKIELLAKDEVLESLTRRVGFRRLEVVGSQLLVNGQSVKLAGV